MNHRITLLSLALAGCTASPPPRSALDHGVDIPDAFAAATAALNEGADRLADGWWRAFDDPGLDAAIAAALAHNRDLHAAAARLAAAASIRDIRAAEAWPELDLGLDGGRSRRVFVGFPFGGGGVPSSTATTYGLSLNLRWELDLWGRIRAADAAAIADLQASTADLQAVRLSLAGQVCKTWFAVAEASLQLDLAERTAEAFQKTADDVRERFRRGIRPAVDVHVALTNLHNAKAAIARHRQQLEAGTRQLELLTGSYPTAQFAAARALPERIAAIPVGLPSALLQRRPDLVATERRLAAAGCRVDAARAALYPRLSLTASGGTTSTELEDLVDPDFRVWSLGTGLLQPLLRGGALRAEVARNQALLDESLAVFGSTLLAAFLEVENALAAEQQLAERESSQAEAAEHALRAYDLALDRWQRGLAEFLLVADSQRQTYQTEAARLLTSRQRLDNRIDLILALGGGFTADASSEETAP